MANSVYKSTVVKLIDGRSLEIRPLKIYYLRKFMEEFSKLSTVSEEDEKIGLLVKCTAIAMEQYMPEISTEDLVEDSLDLNVMYKVIEVAGGISFDSSVSQETEDKKNGSSWEDLDLVTLESQVFLLGIWKDFYEMETSISMPELIAILEAKRETDNSDKKFMAAIQGVDLDAGKPRQDEWTKLKDKVFGTKSSEDTNDVTSLKGAKAAKAGFGIGMGLDYQRVS